MKKVLVVLFLIIVSCAPLKGVSVDGLTHVGETVYYNGFPAASLSSIELSYDDGRLVREYTFVLTSAEYNSIALNIIKFIRQHNPNVEVEVELKR